MSETNATGQPGDEEKNHQGDQPHGASDASGQDRSAPDEHGQDRSAPDEHGQDRTARDFPADLGESLREFAEQTLGNAAYLAGEAAGQLQAFLSGDIAGHAKDLAANVAETTREFLSNDPAAKIRDAAEEAVQEAKDLGARFTDGFNGRR